MKTLTKTLALATLALGFLGTSAMAEETVVVAPAFRCTSCGAQYQVKTKVMKDNSIQMKFEKLVGSGNSKTR